MQAKTEITIGNFIVSLKADYDAQFLADLGLKWIAQRQTSIDKTLGGFEKVDGKDKRIAGWKRNDVDFSEQMAKDLAAELTTLSLPDTEKKLEATEVLVTEYVREVGEPKYAGAKRAMSRHESANDLEVWLKDKIGYAGPTHGDDGEYHVDALRAIKSYVDKLNSEL